MTHSSYDPTARTLSTPPTSRYAIHTNNPEAVAMAIAEVAGTSLIVCASLTTARKIFEKVDAMLTGMVTGRTRTNGRERLQLLGSGEVRIAWDGGRGESPALVITDLFGYSMGLVDLGPLLAMGADLVVIDVDHGRVL